MDDRVWRNISIGLGVICALLIGFAGALMVVGGHSETSAGATPSPLVGEPTPTPAPSTSLVASAEPTPIYTGPATPTPAPSQTADFATVAFAGMALDATSDSHGTARTFTFQTDGNGPLNLSVTKISAGGSVRMCLKVDAGSFACRVGTPTSLPSMTKAFADTDHSTWTLTLIGYNTSKPIVDVSITWPTNNPKITLTHGRLQGSSTAGVSDALNGFTAVFRPRNPGSLNIQASWTEVTVNAEMTLTDVTSTTPVKLDDRTYTAATFVNPIYTFSVDPTKTYQIALRDQSADSQRPDLTAEIAFP